MFQKLHRGVAVLLGLFLVLHIGTHIWLSQGLEAHLARLEMTRPLYRNAIIEPVLLGLFALQILLGLSMVLRRGWPNGGWAWAQVVSGLYIALFLMIHVSAALMARAKYGSDFTDSYWAAAVVSRAPYVFGFAPYYWAAVASVFIHIATAIRFRHWGRPVPAVSKILVACGVSLATVIVWSLVFYAQQGVPPANETYLIETFGF